MELDKRNIEEYINRFLEGETTNAEEQAIYRFFHTGDVPSHLMILLEKYICLLLFLQNGELQASPSLFFFADRNFLLNALLE